MLKQARFFDMAQPHDDEDGIEVFAGGDGGMTRNKFGAVKTFYDGQWFDSGWEARRYAELRLLERAGEISDLQVKKHTLEVVPAHVSRRTGKPVAAATFTPDFSYVENGELVYDDAKGKTTATATLRRKAVEQRHDVIVWFSYAKKGRK